MNDQKLQLICAILQSKNILTWPDFDSARQYCNYTGPADTEMDMITVSQKALSKYLNDFADEILKGEV